MAQRVTRRELDELVVGVVELVELAPNCHRKGGVRVAYGDGRLELVCHTCGRAMFDVQVARGDGDG